MDSLITVTRLLEDRIKMNEKLSSKRLRIWLCVVVSLLSMNAIYIHTKAIHIMLLSQWPSINDHDDHHHHNDDTQRQRQQQQPSNSGMTMVDRHEPLPTASFSNYKQQQQQQEQGPPVVAQAATITYYYYSRTRGDRAGSAILDMLMAHAYAFWQNQSSLSSSSSLHTRQGGVTSRYGGACGTIPFITLPNQRKLIATLGLQSELTYSCPPAPTTTTAVSTWNSNATFIKSNNNNQNKFTTTTTTTTPRYELLEYDTYASIVSESFSKEWLDYIRSRSLLYSSSSLHEKENVSQKQQQTTRIWMEQRQQDQQQGHYQIVVHVRRGDVTLCGTKFKRYFPNAYYLALIDQYKQQSTQTTRTNGSTRQQQEEQHQQQEEQQRPVNVTIFSNLEDPNAHNAHEPRESWYDFTSRGYHVVLGSDLGETWQAMIAADVLILSKSSFSHVPAMFNRHGTVVYTPYWTQPLPGWDILPKESSKVLVRRLMQQARKKYCGNFTMTPWGGQGGRG